MFAAAAAVPQGHMDEALCKKHTLLCMKSGGILQTVCRCDVAQVQIQDSLQGSTLP